jgi:type II secretory pathway component GspD/PulD (secretin)
MVTDIESQIKGIDKFIEKIDLMTPQVLVEVRIYDISTNEGFELGPEWNLSRNTPLKTIDTSKTDIRSDSPVTSEVTTDYTETTSGYVTTDYTETTSGYYRDSDDGPPQSFTVTGTSTEVTQLPIGSFFDSEVEQYTTRRRKPFVGGSFDRIEGGTLSFSLLNDAIDLEFALHVLHQQVEAKLLANPRVLVLDKKTANFEIFREIPYREMRQVGREDPITYTEFKDVGIHLKVTPHITRDSMLRLRVAPEFGVLVSQNLEGVPTVDTRRADTVALVRDGQTIAIGGLRKRQTSKDISKVPLLADLPLLGGLFVSETESIEINELVVFITCKIVIEPTLSDLEKKQLSRTEFASPELSELRLEREHKSRAEAEEFDIAEALDMLLQELESTGK